ncbi:hypothetical protein HHX48_06140 [Salinimonas sp. HHU 13199]|uniref:Methyl-accepting chemotaxis protein n=1 Tax=Salinimonas profundi TaxID=2729140 RepID=A0ABR8LMK1_9ALTE|nr:hypothetical protein [Salinimonas profundi]MBD3585304.1 hypothetical protein [Salinimonas profundi]
MTTKPVAIQSDYLGEQHQAGEEISKRVEEISSKTHDLHKISQNNSSSVVNINSKADTLEALVGRYIV